MVYPCARRVNDGDLVEWLDNLQMRVSFSSTRIECDEFAVCGEFVLVGRVAAAATPVRGDVPRLGRCLAPRSHERNAPDTLCCKFPLLGGSDLFTEV
jgi:hypothetical protein